jgi:Zn-dependent protease with chaperone function
MEGREAHYYYIGVIIMILQRDVIHQISMAYARAAVKSTEFAVLKLNAEPPITHLRIAEALTDLTAWGVEYKLCQFKAGLVCITRPSNVIVVSEEILNIVTIEELKAIFGHEMGHLHTHLEETSSHLAELYADSFASNLDPAYGKHLLSGLLKICIRNKKNISADSATHPSLKNRALTLGLDLEAIIKTLPIEQQISLIRG